MGPISRMVRSLRRHRRYSGCFHSTTPTARMATTVPEIIGRRFGASSHLITSILSMLATITLAGVQITATATIISVLTGGLSTELAILICGAVLVIYTMSGGMWSVTMTDVIHFFVLVGGFTIAVPFVLHNVGGWDAVVAKLPAEQLGFTKVGWKTIIGLIIMYFMTFSTGQESVQRYFAAKDERTAVLGSIICGIIMSLFAFVPAVLGLVALAEFPNIEANNAVATVALNLMPPVMAGFVMAAVVSATLSSGLVTCWGRPPYSPRISWNITLVKGSPMLSSRATVVCAYCCSASSPSSFLS